MQMIIAAEDDLVKARRGALSLSDESEHHTFQCHISPSIEEQLSGRYDAPPLTYGDKENENLTISTKAFLCSPCFGASKEGKMSSVIWSLLSLQWYYTSCSVLLCNTKYNSDLFVILLLSRIHPHTP